MQGEESRIRTSINEIMKPLGIKNYGSIPHLSGSRLGPNDYMMEQGQEIICTKKPRDKWDLVIVQEKLDGGNVGVCKVNGKIIPITRAGYTALSSPYETHHIFHKWAMDYEARFMELLNEGERIVGEWMYHVVGTKYELKNDPFLAFDIMNGMERLPYIEFLTRISREYIQTPKLLHIGQPITIKDVEKLLGKKGHHGADKAEGAVWRVERKGKVDFLAKYVRHGKEDGIYLSENIVNKTIK